MNLLYAAHISTIHSFCQDFLRQWGHLLDLDPDFRLCDEGEGDLLLREALEDVLERHYADPDPGFDRMLEILAPERDDKPLVDTTLELYQKLRSHAKPKQWLDDQRWAYLAEGSPTPPIPLGGRICWGGSPPWPATGAAGWRRWRRSVKRGCPHTVKACG